MSTEKPRSAEPQGAWVRDVVRDLAQDGATDDESPSGSEARPTATAPPEDHQREAPPPPKEHQGDATPPREENQAPTAKTTEPQEPEPEVSRFDGAAITSRIRHGDTPVRRVARWVTGNARAGRDNAHLVERFDALRRPITTGRRVAVVGARGGVGATTLALLMGAVLAAWRDDDVLGLDTDAEPGSLLWRTGLNRRSTAAELVQELRTGGVSSREDLEKRVARTSGGLWVLQSTARGSAEDEELPDPYTLSRELGRFYGVTVLDCGGPLDAAAAEQVRGTAHASVLVVSATVDGVRAAQEVLEQTSDEPGPPTVVALVPRTRNYEGLNLARAERLLDWAGPHVVAVPYDRHLAAGAQIDVGRLAEGTLVAVVEVAGQALALATSRGGSAGGSNDGATAGTDGRQP